MPHDKDLKIIGLGELRSHNNMEDGLWVSYHGHVNSAWIQEHVELVDAATWCRLEGASAMSLFTAAYLTQLPSYSSLI